LWLAAFWLTLAGIAQWPTRGRGMRRQMRTTEALR
jgi:hypothetical protein